MNSVSKIKSEPKANPKIILNIPAMDIKKIPKKLDLLLKINGVDKIKVMIVIEKIVPKQKDNTYKIPVYILGSVGIIVNKTAALPASPCMTPMI